jgi:hypothetical protein
MRNGNRRLIIIRSSIEPDLQQINVRRKNSPSLRLGVRIGIETKLMIRDKI